MVFPLILSNIWYFIILISVYVGSVNDYLFICMSFNIQSLYLKCAFQIFLKCNLFDKIFLRRKGSKTKGSTFCFYKNNVAGKRFFPGRYICKQSKVLSFDTFFRRRNVQKEPFISKQKANELATAQLTTVNCARQLYYQSRCFLETSLQN